MIKCKVRSVEQRKAATALVLPEVKTHPSFSLLNIDLQVEPTPGWMAGLQHQHQMDAWNSDLSVVEGSTEELTSGKLTARRRFDLISASSFSLSVFLCQVASQPSPAKFEFRAQHQPDVSKAGEVEHGHHRGGRHRSGGRQDVQRGGASG